jgi:nitroreductase
MTPTAPFDLSVVDDLLSTTRSVRKRLDLERPVEPAVIDECLQLAVQAPTGSNAQSWRWVVVADPDKRAALGDLYRKGGQAYLDALSSTSTGDAQTDRVINSAVYLAEHVGEVPLHVIPCIQGKISGEMPNFAVSSLLGSILPAVWSFQLALRSRGLGSTLTTLHLAHEQEAAELLGIPDDMTQVALLPVAYTKGTDFKRAARPPVSKITYWDNWGDTRTP